MFSLVLPIDLVVASYVKENYLFVSFNIHYPYISCYRKRSPTCQFSVQWMIVKRRASFTLQEQSITLLKLLDQFNVRFYPFFVMLIKVSMKNYRFHSASRCSINSSTVLKGPETFSPRNASSVARFSRFIAAGLGSPQSSASSSIRRPSTAALIITRRYAWAESKPSCFALTVNFLRTDGSIGTCRVDVSLISKGYQRDINMSNRKLSKLISLYENSFDVSSMLIRKMVGDEGLEPPTLSV